MQQGDLSDGLRFGHGRVSLPCVAHLCSSRTSPDRQVHLFECVEQLGSRSSEGGAAAGASVAVVFANADAGENFVSIDHNIGDRNNLTLWGNGDDLIKAVASVNNNTIVVLHTVGPVIIDYARQHPNITAILWAGLPGQESGNSLVDVLYGKVNPQGRSPFTWAKKESDYGVELLYKAPNGAQPSQSFDEGVFIDYRRFQKAGIEAVYEFGAGLSYTTFEYSNLSVVATNASSYKPLQSLTRPAPTYGTIDKTRSANEAPEGFSRISPYVYPWIVNNASITLSAGVNTSVAALDGSAQPIPPAGGAPGGHPGLYEVVYTISFSIKNTGKLAGTEIPQLVSLYICIIEVLKLPSSTPPLFFPCPAFRYLGQTN